MKNREVTLMEVLNFREEKAMAQRKMNAIDQDAIVVSLGMNIPGPVKSGSSIFCAFCEGRRELQNIFLDQGGTILQEQTLEGNAGYAAIYLIQGIELEKVKKRAILFEETHPLGRLFDVDVMTEKQEPLSRTEVGMAPRKCLICGENAKVCGRSRKHTVQELQDKVWSIISNWEEHR